MLQDKDFKKEIQSSIQTLSQCEWTKEEFSASEFDDKRLFLRLLAVAGDLSRQPMAPINQASGTWNLAKSAYRFFDNDKVTAEAVLKSHVIRTRKRVGNHTGTVLAIQDTTYLNYSHMKCSKDLGPIGEHKQACMGLVMHTIFAVTSEGLPLGFLSQDIWARGKERADSSSYHRENTPIERKDSYKWLKALKKLSTLLGKEQKVVTVCDREADIFRFFEYANELNMNVLVRSKHDRCLESGDHLWRSLDAKPVNFTHSVDLPYARNQTVHFEVRFSPVQIARSSHKKNINRSQKYIRNLTAIYLKEVDAPAHREPITWMLLSNLKCTSRKQALKVIGWYQQRWKIEVLHRIMKSGCSIELTRLETNARRFPFLALKSIIAWRLMLIAHYNKVSPNAPASSILTQTECDALFSIKHNQIVKNQSFVAKKAIAWLAELGGYLARKSDPLPGPTHVWRGWQRLQDYSRMFVLATS
jgi:hypothetical protein